MDCSVMVWDISSGRALHTFSTQPEVVNTSQMVNPPFCYSVAVSECGRACVAALGNAEIACYNLTSRAALKRRLTGHTNGVIQCVFPRFTATPTTPTTTAATVTGTNSNSNASRWLLSAGNDQT